MQIVIDIPKECIPTRQDVIDIQLHFVDGKVVEASGYGFAVLPKHGRLIDADNVDDVYVAYDRNCILSRIDAPIILEANK